MNAVKPDSSTPNNIKTIKPSVFLLPGERNVSINEIERILINAEVPIFCQGSRLVKLVEIKPKNEKGIYQRDSETLLMPVEKVFLADLITECCAIFKYDRRANEYKVVDCPYQYAESYIARSIYGVRELKAIISAPTLLSDFTILDKPGYNNISGLYLSDVIPSDYRSPPREPTKTNALSALLILNGLLDEFPFVSDADKSALIALIISSLVRASMESAPMGCLTANAPGTGKSIACDVISIISTGKRPSVISQGKDSDETEKRLGGALLSGCRTIVLDNSEHPIRGDFLCQVISQPKIKIRPLGVSTMVDVHSNSMFLANGNNLDVRGDMKRRVVLVRFDAGTERPEQRKFKRNIIEYTKKNRGKLIEAILTIPLSYKQAGSPELNVTPYGGFSDWDKFCRFPLIWLGLTDPLSPSETLRETDPDFASQRELYSAWFKLYKTTHQTAAEIICGADDELKEVLNSVCFDKLTSRVFAGWLRRHKGRIVDELKLESSLDSHTKIHKWYLTKCG